MPPTPSTLSKRHLSLSTLPILSRARTTSGSRNSVTSSSSKSGPVAARLTFVISSVSASATAAVTIITVPAGPFAAPPAAVAIFATLVRVSVTLSRFVATTVASRSTTAGRSARVTLSTSGSSAAVSPRMTVEGARSGSPFKGIRTVRSRSPTSSNAGDRHT